MKDLGYAEECDKHGFDMDTLDIFKILGDPNNRKLKTSEQGVQEEERIARGYPRWEERDTRNAGGDTWKTIFIPFFVVSAHRR